MGCLHCTSIHTTFVFLVSTNSAYTAHSCVLLDLVGDFQLMFVYICIPLVGCGGPLGAESSSLSSYSSGIKKSVSQMYAKYSSSNNS